MVAALAAGCSADPEDPAEIGLVEGFAGIVVADEPRAAVVARDILGNGGNAADAAVAMYFTMSVTLPSRASLGAGGACVLYDNGENVAEALLFLPRPENGAVAPQAPRAMAALHARHGLMRWQFLLGPAERLARFGHPVSRAFARDLAAAAPRLAASPEMARTFRTKAGRLPEEGQKIEQLELAGVLGGLRAQGAGYLYAGVFTSRFVEAARVAGQAMSVEQVRETVPVFAEPVGVEYGDHMLYFLAPPAANGLLAAQLWTMLNEVLDLEPPGSAARAHQIAEAAGRAFADRDRWMGPDGAPRAAAADDLLARAHLREVLDGYREDRHTLLDRPAARPPAAGGEPYGASILAIDRWNNVVACGFTMNGLFGDFRMAPETGIVLAAAPEDGTGASGVPSAAILVNTNAQTAYFAGAASGGGAATTALVSTMVGALVDEAPLSEVLARPRIHQGAGSGVTFHEKGVPAEVLDGLRDRGHVLRGASALGRVNALQCPRGSRRSPGECSFATDLRGFGLGLIAQ